MGRCSRFCIRLSRWTLEISRSSVSRVERASSSLLRPSLIFLLSSSFPSLLDYLRRERCHGCWCSHDDADGQGSFFFSRLPSASGLTFPLFRRTFASLRTPPSKTSSSTPPSSSPKRIDLPTPKVQISPLQETSLRPSFIRDLAQDPSPTLFTYNSNKPRSPDLDRGPSTLHLPSNPCPPRQLSPRPLLRTDQEDQVTIPSPSSTTTSVPLPLR